MSLWLRGQHHEFSAEHADEPHYPLQNARRGQSLPKAIVVRHSKIGVPMSQMGLGRAKTPAVAPHVEIFPSNCISESQIILHTRGSMPYWRIVFSTFLGCMSFYTARVITGHRRNFCGQSALPSLSGHRPTR